MPYTQTFLQISISWDLAFFLWSEHFPIIEIEVSEAAPHSIRYMPL